MFDSSSEEEGEERWCLTLGFLVCFCERGLFFADDAIDNKPLGFVVKVLEETCLTGLGFSSEDEAKAEEEEDLSPNEDAGFWELKKDL